MSEVVVSSILVIDEHNQIPIYYVSRALHGAELKYFPLERLVLALMVTVRRLRPYFQAHPIIVLTNQPLRVVLQKPEGSGRMVNWLIELGEHDISYRSRTTIKGQALVDFLVELTLAEMMNNEDKWTLHVDGSSTALSSGAGLLLSTPEGLEIEYAIWLGFNATNNKAEYEALIASLNLAKEAGVVHVATYTDSKLVEGKVTGEYEVKEDRMKKNT